MDSEADEEVQEETTVDEAVTVDVVVEDVAAAGDEVNKQLITKFYDDTLRIQSHPAIGLKHLAPAPRRQEVFGIVERGGSLVWVSKTYSSHQLPSCFPMNGLRRFGMNSK